MDNIIIRNISPLDYCRIIPVVNDWWGGRQMAGMLPKFFFEHFQKTSFVAQQDGQIAGFIVGFVSQTYGKEAYIHFVGVAPDFRKMDLGRSLYEHFFDTVMDMGCDLVRCVTSPVNKASIAFHKKMAFCIAPADKTIDGVAVAENYDGPGEDRVLFSKRLHTNVYDD
jgi:GNAT superfamily N-acetyltransferase